MDKSPKEIITEIGLLVYGRPDFKNIMARDMGISRNTLDRYMDQLSLPNRAVQSLKGFCAMKAMEKKAHADIILQIAENIK